MDRPAASVGKLSLKQILLDRKNNNIYNKTEILIKEISGKINLTYSKDGDGRITSAIKEKEYLDILERELKLKDPTIIIERPKERYWYDIRINTIPINLKITTGGTDNAFNKVAIFGEEPSNKCMNYNQWYKFVKNNIKKQVNFSLHTTHNK